MLDADSRSAAERNDRAVDMLMKSAADLIAAAGSTAAWPSALETFRRRLEDTVECLRLIDHVTALPNRAGFIESLRRSLARLDRGERAFAVLCFDLDRFRDIADALGHLSTDRLLRALAERLRIRLRSADIVARIGGDEFAVLQSGVDDPAQAAVLAQELMALMHAPFSIDGHQISLTASLGIHVVEEAGDGVCDAEEVLAHASTAMHRAKTETRGTFRFFDSGMDAEVRHRAALVRDLREAIAAGALSLEYQPQVDLASGRIVGVEALARWTHPVRGRISPSEFIPLAEESGLIEALGKWVLTAATRQARAWLDAGLKPVTVGVNVSALQFRSPYELEQHILRALLESNLPARQLELELTESALMEGEPEGEDVLQRLRGMGVRLAIDDFGTGYCSLDYLRRLPFDRVKLARSFVAGLASAPGSRAIVRAALSLTRELGLAAIAEGLETDEERRLLLSWGCADGQSFYFSRPLPPDQMTKLLERDAALPEIAPAPAAPRHRAPVQTAA